MKFFFDNCVPPRVAKAIQDLDEHVEITHLRLKFPPETKDVDWINKLAAEGGWAVITYDQIWKVPQQKEALIRSKLTAFFLTKGWANQTMMEQARKLMGIWEKLKAVAQRANLGDCFRIPASGQNIDPFALG